MASKGFKQRQHMRDTFAGASQMLGADALGAQFRGLQGLASPFLNQMAASQGLQGQAQAGTAMANMSRMGLGGTGLGAALGSGLQAGSAFQGNQLRARMFQDLLGQAQQTQAMRSNMFFQQGMQGAGTFRGFGDVLREDIMPIAQMAGSAATGGMMFGAGGGGGGTQFGGRSSPSSFQTTGPGYGPGINF